MTNLAEQLYDPKNAEIHDMAHRYVDDGEVVLRAAGITKLDRATVELRRNGKVRQLETSNEGDAYDAAWDVYSNYGKSSDRTKTA